MESISGKITYFTRFQTVAGFEASSRLSANLYYIEGGACCHHFNLISRLYFTGNNAEINDYTLIRIVIRVENEGRKGCFAVARWGGNIGNDSL